MFFKAIWDQAIASEVLSLRPRTHTVADGCGPRKRANWLTFYAVSGGTGCPRPPWLVFDMVLIGVYVTLGGAGVGRGPRALGFAMWALMVPSAEAFAALAVWQGLVWCLILGLSVQVAAVVTSRGFFIFLFLLYAGYRVVYRSCSAEARGVRHPPRPSRWAPRWRIRCTQASSTPTC